MKKEMGGKRKCDIDICTSIYIYIYLYVWLRVGCLHKSNHTPRCPAQLARAALSSLSTIRHQGGYPGIRYSDC